MKNLLRYVFAALLATTGYYYSNGTESNNLPPIETQLVEDEYRIVDEAHPNPGQLVDAEDIGAYCKGELQICAEPTNPESGLPTMFWEGSTVKF